MEIRNELGLVGTQPHGITSQLGNYIWGTFGPHDLFSLLFFSQMAAVFAELMCFVILVISDIPQE